MFLLSLVPVAANWLFPILTEIIDNFQIWTRFNFNPFDPLELWLDQYMPVMTVYKTSGFLCGLGIARH